MPPLPRISPLLIKQLHDGSERAFQLIYEEYHTAIYRFAYTFVKDVELSKEITQETFLSLWIHRQKISAELPLHPYLFGKARKLTIDAFRRMTTASRVKEELKVKTLGVSNETEETILLNELQQITAAAFNKLSQQQQLVFKLSRMHGRSYEEIAAEMKISKNTVKYHLVCALKSLKNHLIKYDTFYIGLILYAAMVK